MKVNTLFAFYFRCLMQKKMLLNALLKEIIAL